jgi:hypothetical protein
MPQSNVINVNKSIKIIKSTGKLQLTKVFADSNLSKSALKYAETTGDYYNWDWGKSSFIVVYELPQLFNAAFGELLRYLVNYCFQYMKDEDLNDSIIYTKFMDNYGKTIKY